jgi:hypothetical protein
MDWIEQNRRVAQAALILGCLSIILRVVLLFSTDVLLNTGDDGASYASLARMIGSADFSKDDGSRSPGYPLLLALLGSQPVVIRLTQLALGLCTTGMLFVLTWRLTGSALGSFSVGACYGLSVTQARYEASLLTETLTTFSLSCIFLTLARTASPTRAWRSGGLAFGLLAGIPALVRPAFAFLPVALAYWLLLSVRPRVHLLYFLAPALAPVLIWSAFNQARFGMFTPSTVLGFNLANHTGAYVEYASDRYSTIKEAYEEALRDHPGDARRINLLHEPVDCSTVEQGQPCTVQSKIRALTGQTVPELSRTLTQMFLEVFSAHPTWYVVSVYRAWTQFWIAPTWPEGLVYGDATNWWLRRIAWAEKVVMVGTNVVFLTTSCGLIVHAALRRRSFVAPSVVIMAGCVLVASILNSMLDPAETPRYGTPLQPFAACVVVTTIAALRTMLRISSMQVRRGASEPVQS